MKRQGQRHFGSISTEFDDYWKASGRKVHGGLYSRGRRKTKRPFDSRKPMHLVLRSSRARGSSSMLGLSYRAKIKSAIEHFAKKNTIAVYRFSNNGNHLHLLIRAKRRSDLGKFLRTVSGIIARIVLNAKKGASKGRFWDALAFTRICEWGRALKNLDRYVVQNILEAAGIIPYQPRKYKSSPTSAASNTSTA